MILNSSLQSTLQAAANRIIPADDYPNAWEGGVGFYLERQFATDLSRSVPAYEAGLAALEAEARIHFDAPFVTLLEAQQDELLRRVEAGEVQTEWSVPPRRFFAMLVQHVAEGYYCDPMNLGNVGLRSWQMVGFVPRCD
ncbi:MAG: hypothetical protein JWN98_1640 [Abditibacteriota bacterium]|nr:hypothetical protein [Abditibacteriota bacterium]